MDVILPKSRPARRRPLWAALALLALAVLAAAVFFLLRPRAVSDTLPVPPEDPAEAVYRTRLEGLEKEIRGLTDAMAQVEEMGDRAKYAQIARAAAAKTLEADSVWYEWRAASDKKNGLAAGMEQSFYEGWQPVRFTEKDKLDLLAAEHGLSADAVRRLKAEIEVMFWDEFAEKFAPLPEEASGPSEVRS